MMESARIPDSDLVAQALEGSAEAIRELDRRHRPSVYELLHRMVRDADLAEDLTQEVFIKAFRQLETQRTESSFSKWILRIANNHALDHYKRVRRLKKKGLGTVPLEPTPDAPSPRHVRFGTQQAARSIDTPTPTPTPGDRHHLAPALQQALARLQQKYRELIILQLEGRSYEDIAEILGIPASTVGTRLQRAREELKAALADTEQLLDDAS